MRGLLVSRNADWEYFNNVLIDEDNLHLFFEGLVCESTQITRLHLLVPTLLSMKLDEIRSLSLCRIWDKQTPVHAKKEVLYKQEIFTSSCAFCARAIKTNNSVPYQVVLRFIASVPADENAEKIITYDIFICVLCRTCQYIPWHALIPIHDANYASICAAVSTLAFTEAFDDADIASLYMERILHLNEETPQFLALALQQQLKCVYCGCTNRKRLALCLECKCVAICCSSKCVDIGCAHHTYWMCKRLREVGLLDIEKIVSIDENGNIDKGVE